jgi:3-dehydroquinate dehydratase
MTRICVPICARSIDGLRDAIEWAAAVADIIELRLDCLDDFETASQIPVQVRNAGRPLILTLRCAEQGGHSPADYDSRWRFWLLLAPTATDSFSTLNKSVKGSLLAESGPASG